MDSKVYVYGGAAVAVVALLMARRGSGAAIINRPNDGSAVAEAQGRAAFASRGLDAIASVARADIDGTTRRYTAGVAGAASEYASQAQYLAQRSRDAAYTAVGLAQANAAKTAADASKAGKSGFGISIPGFGDFGIHW